MAFDDRHTDRLAVIGLLSIVVAAAVPMYGAYQRAIARSNANGEATGAWWHASTTVYLVAIAVVSVVFSTVAIGGVCRLAARVHSLWWSDHHPKRTG